MPADGHNSPSSVRCRRFRRGENSERRVERLRLRGARAAAHLSFRRNNREENGWRIKMEFREEIRFIQPSTHDSITRS